MIDLGISKLALIGAVALIVIGPEKLPKVARTLGAMIGKAQRYVADVKAEVNRAMELDELKKMKESMESAAQNVQQSFNDTTNAFEKDWKDATSGLDGTDVMTSQALYEPPLYMPQYRHPGKKWRLKQSATPGWYKARQGVRTKALSGAARVARFRPRKDAGMTPLNP
jgi:sec-independent protein translocase protein TatB